MPGLRDARPVLGPLISWSKAVITESRRLGHEDQETAQWIKTCAKNSGWSRGQINGALRFNGVRKHDPILVVCPRCDDVGRLNIWHSKMGKTHAAITHGKLPGFWFWGKSVKGKTRRRTRCRFYRITPYERKRLLDQMYEKLDLLRKYG